MTNPRWIYWTRDFCCWLPAPPLGWGSTKQNTLVLSLPGNPSYDEAMWTSTDTTVDKPTKSRLSVFISAGWTAFCTFTESPTYSSRPIPSLTTLHFLTPQNTSFLFVKMVRCTFYFTLVNAGYYLNKISRDSSVSIVTWVSIEWVGDRSLNSSRQRSLSPVTTSKPFSCPLSSYLMCTMRSYLGTKAVGAWT